MLEVVMPFIRGDMNDYQKGELKFCGLGNTHVCAPPLPCRFDVVFRTNCYPTLHVLLPVGLQDHSGGQED